MAGGSAYPGETQNPYRHSQALVAGSGAGAAGYGAGGGGYGYDDDFSAATESDSTHGSSAPRAPQQQAQQQYYQQPLQQEPQQQQQQQQYQRARTNSRGVALTDAGVVPGPEGIRRVARPQSRRPSSQAPTNRYSRGSMYAPGSGAGSGATSPTSTSAGGGGVPQLPPGAAPPRPYPEY